MAKALRAEHGYSLVEVMVAILLLSIAIIPMVGMFDAGLRAAVVGGNYDKGRTLANEKLEGIKALPYSSPDPEPASATANSVVEIFPPGTNNCAGTMDPLFTSCQVATRYVSLTATEVAASTGFSPMMEATVTMKWDGGRKSYTTTGLVSQQSLEAE